MSYNISKRVTTSPAIRAFSTGARGTASDSVHHRCQNWLQSISSKPTPASPPRQQVVLPVKPASPIRDPEPVPEPRTPPFTTHISLRRPRVPITIAPPPPPSPPTPPIHLPRKRISLTSREDREARVAWQKRLLAQQRAREASLSKPAPPQAPVAASKPTQLSEPPKPPPIERLSRLGCRPLPEAEHQAALQAARERTSRQLQLGVAKTIAEWEATKAKYLKGPEPVKPAPSPGPRFEPTPEPSPEPAFELSPEPVVEHVAEPQLQPTHDTEPAEEFEEHLQLQDSFERPPQPTDLDRWVALSPNLSTVLELTEGPGSTSPVTESDSFSTSAPSSPCAGLSRNIFEGNLDHVDQSEDSMATTSSATAETDNRGIPTPPLPCVMPSRNVFEGILDDIDAAIQRTATAPLPAQTTRSNIFADLDLREEFQLPAVATTVVWTDKPEQQQQPCAGVLCRFTTKAITMAKAAWAKVKNLVWD